MGAEPHLPVLLKTIITALQPISGGRYIDGTVGAGGHAAGLLEASGPDGEVLGLDLDGEAVGLASARLARFGARAHVVEGSYTGMRAEAGRLGWDVVDGILLDLGVSSMQLDGAGRGFSFLQDGPLDMRFATRTGRTAADVVNFSDESELAEIIFRYGEDRLGRRIARAIVNNRPFESTRGLADVILRAVGRRERIHPATRTFQALRIAVNGELESVEAVLPVAMGLLKAGGRLAVISFHSLEDRLVKEYFRRESVDCICPGRQPVCTCSHRASLLEVYGHKPVEADEAEKELNSRSRSAKLRVAEKLV